MDTVSAGKGSGICIYVRTSAVAATRRVYRAPVRGVAEPGVYKDVPEEKGRWPIPLNEGLAVHLGEGLKQAENKHNTRRQREGWGHREVVKGLKCNVNKLPERDRCFNAPPRQCEKITVQ